jgi:(1->4)-alpha-D-glucan 1-alpha-D-glucosylmutase
LTLVDPDNRHPVDFEKRRESLQEIRQKIKKDLPGLIEDLLENREDGRIKQFLIHRVLEFRNENEMLFQSGDYIPLKADGEFSRNLIAFARAYEGQTAIVVAPRFLSRLVRENDFPLGSKTWQDTELKLPDQFPSSWIDIITTNKYTDESHALPVGDLLSSFPACLLVNEEVR